MKLVVQAFSSLRETLGSNIPQRNSPATPQSALKTESKPAPHNKLTDFRLDSPNLLRALRNSFSELNCARSDRQRQEVLAELVRQLKAFALLNDIPELLPAAQLALAVQGLLTQLSGKPCDVSASALRTIAGALLLLDALCRSTLPPDLATNPPIRLLVVDDDAVSRVALAVALKKAFPLPDIAPASEAALALAAQDHYDVIFLDVEMPGMDGYELCCKLRGTPLNHTTPIIFVTRHHDFESRARSTHSGGQDLIAKPFLPGEITVKALTFVLRARLQRYACTRSPQRELCCTGG